MPHFIIDCSENIIHQRTPDEIMQAVYDAKQPVFSLRTILKFA